MNRPLPQKQRGVVLLALTLILILGSAWLLIIKLNDNARRSANYEQSMRALNEAKQALIAYAVTYYESNPGDFGFLPCPDLTTAGEEGNQEVPCGAQYVNSIGKFPWQSLGMSPVKDAYGQCLWYAVSGAYKGGSNRSDMLNDDTTGTFRIFAADGATVVAGATPMERPVAVIFAPGRSINNQNRSDPDGAMCEGNEAVNYIAGNYLDPEFPAAPMTGIRNYDIDTVNPDIIDRFILTNDPESETFNDIMLYITADEIFDAIKLRNDFEEKLFDDTSINNLTYRLTECLAEYSEYNNDNHDDSADDNDGNNNDSLPWPAPLDLIDYRDDTEYDDRTAAGTTLVGRLPMIIDDSNAEIYPVSCNDPPHDCTAPDDDLKVFCRAFWTTDSDDLLTGPEADELLALWENWKDHLYYAVSQEYQPQTMNEDTDECGSGTNCLTLNAPAASTTDWAAVVFFSGETLVGQTRSAPPIDADQKLTISNYLEDLNTTPYDDGDDTVEYANNTIDNTFNDIVYCINDDDDDGIDEREAGRCPP